ncbi:hypothetical protein F383_17477 [Gossypium arboreum]|uniref:Uncharacterized protein n=1 Tax=Gossypium arboreum TaxID=29729 RepID=A0A0B0NDB9_GOSAR|nr:hypothetical protein F383_17477 [Gossypium arboreum]
MIAHGLKHGHIRPFRRVHRLVTRACVLAV